MDFALSGFAALMAALTILVSGWITPETAARLEVMATAPLSQTGTLAWGPAAAGLLLTAGPLLVAGLVITRPKPLQRA